MARVAAGAVVMTRIGQFVLLTVLLLAVSIPAGGPSHVVAQAPTPAPAPLPQPTPAPDDAPAKSVITLHDGRPVPENWKLGFSIPLSAAKSSAGPKEQSVRWYIDPPDFDQYCVRRDNGRSIDVQTGVEPVKLRVRLAVAKGDTFDETTVEIQAGTPKPPAPPPGPTPPPNPPPGPTPPVPPAPTPGPAPTDAFGKLGYDYAGQLIKSYADTMDESASMLAAGVSRKAVIADFDKRWKARRDKASAVSAAEFAKIVPDDKEPVGDQKDRLSDAWRQFAKGVSSR